MNINFYANFPSQLKQRNPKWYKDCINSAIDQVTLEYHGIRQTYQNKLRNYNLANDIFDFTGLRKQMVPMFPEGGKFPIDLQHYPIAKQKIDLLIGEELKRPFNFTARITNDDAISQKEEEMEKQLDDFFIEQLKSQSQSEEEFKAKLEEKMAYLQTNFQDKREKLANQLLTYYWYFLDLKELFNRGFEDLLICGEEIYRVDILGNEPVVLKTNPLNITVVGGNDSPFVEDGSIIIEDNYQSPAQIIDNYYDELSFAQVKKIEDSLSNTSKGGKAGSNTGFDSVPEYVLVDVENNQGMFQNEHRSLASVNEVGDIRVSRVVWKSRKKIMVLTYYDEASGQFQQEIVHKNHELDEEAGEVHLEPLWINEAVEGTRIGDETDDIYVKQQALPIQNRRIDNISKCSLGYVGVYYNVNNNRAMSMMDRLFPFQRVYNLFMNKLNFLYTKYKGPIYKLDFSTMPDDYEPEEILYYAEMLGWELSDPFNEGKEGQALGKLAGNMNQNSGVKDANLYSIIQQTIEMLNYIEQQAGSVSGISKSREGQISSREAVSNVTREITQSSHITERWFSVHDQVKRKTLELFLETAKFAFKNKNKKAQYILDDSTMHSLTIDGNDLNEATYDIQILDTSKIQELFNDLKQLSHAAMQNDKMTMKGIMDIYTDNSIASIKRKMEAEEEKKYKRDAEGMKHQEKLQELQIQQENLKIDKENEIKLLMQSREIQKDILISLNQLSSKDKLSTEELKVKKELEILKEENKKTIESLKIKMEEKKLNAIERNKSVV